MLFLSFKPRQVSIHPVDFFTAGTEGAIEGLVALDPVETEAFVVDTFRFDLFAVWNNLQISDISILNRQGKCVSAGLKHHYLKNGERRVKYPHQRNPGR